MHNYKVSKNCINKNLMIILIKILIKKTIDISNSKRHHNDIFIKIFSIEQGKTFGYHTN